MGIYHVKIEWEQAELYCFSEVVEANSKAEAIAKAQEIIDYDISPYATGDYDEIWQEESARLIEEQLTKGNFDLKIVGFPLS